jgi:hypothetical protein
MKRVASSNPRRDSALDREIETALAVDPSIEFVARVRNRIEKQPEPASWTVTWHIGRRVRWTLFATAAIGAAILAVAIARQQRVAELEAVKSVPAQAMLSSLAEADLPPTTYALPSRAPQVSTPSQSSFKEPEVLRSPDETNAILRILSGPAIHWVEIQTMEIVPQSLPVTPVTPIPIYDPFRTGQSAPVATPKGDNQ